MTATVVLVHGAWHGAWCWEAVTARLDAAGVPSLALDLPGHGESAEPLGDLATDAQALTRTLAAIEGPTVVCGHSYGGAVVSQGAADNRDVRHLVFISAFCLDVGESCTNAAPGALPDVESASLLADALRFDESGAVTLDPDLAIPALYQDCSPDDATAAVARLDTQALAELAGVATAAAWRSVPSTYAVCVADQAVPPALQHVLARRCTRTVEWDTGHSPFLARPDLVADLLIDLARSTP